MAFTENKVSVSSSKLQLTKYLEVLEEFRIQSQKTEQAQVIGEKQKITVSIKKTKLERSEERLINDEIDGTTYKNSIIV